MQWIPPWLATTYAKIVVGFGSSIFSTGDAAALTRLEGRKLNLSVSRLASHGWLVRVGKGRYLALEPLAIMTALEGDWPSKLKGYPDAVPLVQVALSEIIREYGSRLVSVVVFGSLARRGWNETSDIDLLVVADGLPDEYPRRLESVRRVADACSPIRASQWTRTGRDYHLLDLILLRRDELDGGSNQLFMLDLTRDAIFLYDKDGFLSEKLKELGRKLDETGAMRISTPTGKSHYWDLRGAMRER